MKIFSLTSFTLFVMLGLTTGCGKEAENSGGTPEKSAPSITERDAYLEKQSMSCERNQACPSYLTKLVVVHGNEYRFCTGFLTDENTVATSSTCLPNILRRNNQDCSQDVFFFFPKTANRPAVRMGCEKVLQVSQLEGQDPILWRDDVSFLKMNGSLKNRRQASISRRGVLNNKQFVAWVVDQQDQFSGIAKKVTCESVHNNYVNPLVQNEFSPSMLFADCLKTASSLGAPVVDKDGEVRAMLSVGMEDKLRNYLASTGLLINGLKEIFHATNFACAQTPDDSDMEDEVECSKDLTYTEVDRLRSDMLATGNLFSALKKNFEKSLAGLNPYVVFGVELTPKGDTQDVRIFPKCFRPLKEWLGSLGNKNTYVADVKIPVSTFRRTMDPYGRIQASEVRDPKEPELERKIQFSLKNLRSVKRTTVLIWNPEEDDDTQHFQGITQDCPVEPSLL